MRFGRNGKVVERGQGTVEAAFVLPVLLGLVLFLLQPGIVLYDRVVMKSAAAEACRLLAISGSDFGESEEAVKAFICHRLAAIPPQDLFHVHDSGCSWVIDLSGDEDSSVVTVSIENQVRPLPLISWGMSAIGALSNEGTFRLSVRESAPSQPLWVGSAEVGRDVSGWAGAWLS